MAPLPVEISLVVLNRTTESLAVSYIDSDAIVSRKEVLAPSHRWAERIPAHFTSRTLDVRVSASVTLMLSLSKEHWRRRRGRAARTRRLSAPGSSIAAFTILDSHQPTLELVLLQEPDRRTWMASLPSDRSLADFCIPGTHETLAEYGWPHSSCQSTQSVRLQLERGLRMLDLRFALTEKGILQAYHGIQNEYMLASACFDDLYSFLDEHPSETVICSIKQENAVQEFQAKIFAQIDKRLDRWFLDNRMPTLGEARGKCILFSRFGKGARLGIHPSSWPNNSKEAFDWQLENITVRTQDWYSVSLLEIPEKSANGALSRRLLSVLSIGTAAKVTQLLEGLRPPSVWRLDFASAASLSSGAFPCCVSRGVGISFAGLGIRGVNARLTDWLVKRMASGVALEGCTILLDYFEYPHDSLVTLLIAANFDRTLLKE